jgi:hypothetical protein
LQDIHCGEADPEMRQVKKLTLLAVAMLGALACARGAVHASIQKNFTW